MDCPCNFARPALRFADMFMASLLLCGLFNGQPSCIQADDARGPYKSHDACMERVTEMVADISKGTPWIEIRGFRCAEVEGTST